jgi:hypothetical protein
MAALQKGARISGRDRAKLATELQKAEAKGASIRELAQGHGRSYGFVHRVLIESSAPLRGRGGATRGKTKAMQSSRLSAIPRSCLPRVPGRSAAHLRRGRTLSARKRSQRPRIPR